SNSFQETLGFGALAIAVGPRPVAIAGRAPGLPAAGLGGAARQHLALEDPALHADRALLGARRREAVLDVRAERVQRHAALAIPLIARHLGAAEAAGAGDTDALGAELHGDGHGLLHGAAEGDPALELGRDVLGDQLRVDLGL